jgi:hypothetical protein
MESTGPHKKKKPKTKTKTNIKTRRKTRLGCGFLFYFWVVSSLFMLRLDVFYDPFAPY